MPAAAEEEPAGRRRALIVATTSYADAQLAQLRAPGHDASDFAAVLEDAAIGGFEVETALDVPSDQLRRRIAQFCAHGGPRELALVYLSCHGVLDDRGRLYYATVDTDRSLLAATAIPAAWLNEQLEDCRCRRQILVLDCCHSGAFAKGAKGEAGLALRERFEGRGRVVLTGSRATEYSFEHGHVVGESASSVFTAALVQGLRSGEADRDRDGLVTVSELYDHAYETVRSSDAPQTPTLWTYGAEGDLLVAHSPRGAIVEPAPLPQDLVALLESARPRVREGAVAELADLLRGPDAGRGLTARAQLERIATADIPSVAAAARAALDTVSAPRAPSAPGSGPPPPQPPAAALPAPPSPGRGGPRRARGRRRPALQPFAIAAIAAAVATAVVAGVLALSNGGSGDGGDASPQIQSIALPGQPRGIGVAKDVAWVAQHDAGTVSRIDASSNVEPIDVGRHPGKVVAGDGAVWVGYDDGRRVAQIDPGSRSVTKRIDLAAPNGCACTLTELAIADGMLWVGSADRRAIVTFDATTGRQFQLVYHPGPGFKGVLAVGGGRVWAVGTEDYGAKRSLVASFRVGSEQLERTAVRTGSFFDGVAYGSGTVWIADAADVGNVVTAFDPGTKRAVADVKVPAGIWSDDIAVAAGAVVVWNPDEGMLTRIDADRRTVLDQQRIPGFRRHVKANQDGSDLILAGSSAVVTDPARGRVYQVDW